MPVTAKLSRKFYDRFGDDITNELVDWFNAVDATYREDLRHLNELNFQRFDAKWEQRLAESEAKLERRLAQLEVKLEQRLAEFEVKFEQRLAEFEVKFERRLARLETQLATQKSDTIRWMFGFWTGTVVPLAGLILALHLL